MTDARRLALLLALMFWQGGFMFYGAVVVPVGSAVLESDLAQGFITRRVTWYLNLLAIPALALWAWELLVAPRPRGFRWVCLILLTVMFAGQLLIHSHLDSHLDAEEMRVHDRASFSAWHAAYLSLSTAQWALAVTLLGLTLRIWRRGPADAASDVRRIERPANGDRP